ncbi:MAG: hypothetical protein R3F59_01985 [Myxococcota bacterium]
MAVRRLQAAAAGDLALGGDLVGGERGGGGAGAGAVGVGADAGVGEAPTPLGGPGAVSAAQREVSAAAWASA